MDFHENEAAVSYSYHDLPIKKLNPPSFCLGAIFSLKFTGE